MTTLPMLLPDVPGLVHGIVSIDPPMVQCDGCGTTASERTLALTILLCGILFDPRRRDHRRLCVACRNEAGWGDPVTSPPVPRPRVSCARSDVGMPHMGERMEPQASPTSTTTGPRPTVHFACCDRAYCGAKVHETPAVVARDDVVCTECVDLAYVGRCPECGLTFP